MHAEASSSIPATGPSHSRTASRPTGGPPGVVTRPRSSGSSRGYGGTSFPTWVLSRSTPSVRKSCATGRSGWRRTRQGRGVAARTGPGGTGGPALGLRQGEALGLSADDIDFEKEVVHVRRQVKMVRAKLCFALPKGRKVRDVPLPSSVAQAIRQHMEPFARVPVTLPWDDPTPAETPVEAKHRRPRTYNLSVTGRGQHRRCSCVGAVPGARLSRPAPLLRLRGTGGWRIDRLPGTLAGALRPRVHAAEVLRDLRVAAAVAGRSSPWSVARSPLRGPKSQRGPRDAAAPLPDPLKAGQTGCGGTLVSDVPELLYEVSDLRKRTV
ncbi:hypothetical protein HEP81_02053 [Streptomyces griseofuscus]|uniref:Tyr recombinase domain-containing protein n=1 Tax=Streptomyces griseofuscus TaxID=146922 RepID=A0A7H1PWE9_9ACTN|nr:hypothetical protein HEP81_02053 [Streptomyces griseofuscus]